MNLFNKDKMRGDWPNIETNMRSKTNRFVCRAKSAKVHRTPLDILSLLLLVVWTLVNTADSIRIVRYSSDQKAENVEALLGTNTTLHCDVVLEANDQLYSLKWFKQHNNNNNNNIYYEFYSYIASPAKTIHHTKLPGIKLNVEKEAETNGERITIVHTDLDSEGYYRCEVISDETFQVDRKEFRLTVLVPPQKVPKIVGTRRTYGIGERVQLQCITGTSRPAPKVKWFINDIPVPEWYIAREEIVEHTPVKKSAVTDINYSNSRQSINQTRADNAQTLANQTLIALSTNLSLSSENISKSVEAKRHSQLDFVLRPEHIVDEERFTVRCMAYMETQFYPEVRNSVLNFDVWDKTTPVIEGLQTEYNLGDTVHINCTVPSFHQLEMSQQQQLGQRIQIIWFINGQQVNAKHVVEYFTYGQVGLRFVLQPHHLDENLSLSIKCTSVQLWPTHKLPRQLNLPQMHHSSVVVVDENKPNRNPSNRRKPFKPPSEKDINTSVEQIESSTAADTKTTKSTEIESNTVTADTENGTINLIELFENDTINEEDWPTTTTTMTPGLDTNQVDSDTSITMSHNESNSSSLLDKIRDLTQNKQRFIGSFGITLIPVAVIAVVLLIG